VRIFAAYVYVMLYMFCFVVFFFVADTFLPKPGKKKLFFSIGYINVKHQALFGLQLLQTFYFDIYLDFFKLH